MFRSFLQAEPRPRAALLFLVLLAGILAHWFWNLGWAFVRDPRAGLDFGPPLVILVRLALSLIAALLTFVPTYNKVQQPTSESWVPYFLAFQNGFFWEAALEAMVRGM
jgi:hypothetical protein